MGDQMWHHTQWARFDEDRATWMPTEGLDRAGTGGTDTIQCIG